MARKVKGRITHSETGAPVAGAKVVAWDSDANADDKMGQAVTGEDGRYSITYGAKDWDPDVGASVRPDIYVKVYTKHVKGQWVLNKTSSTHDDQKKKNDLTINLSIRPLPHARMIWGRITRADGTPMRNARVVAWDDDTNTSDDYLGEDGTNANGEYLIDCSLYSPSGEPQAQPDPDVYVNVHYVVDGQEHVYRSYTSMNNALSNGAHIDVTIGG